MIVKGLAYAALFQGLKSKVEERAGILIAELLAAEPVDAGEAEGVVLRVVLEGGLDLVRQVCAVGAVRIRAFADDQRPDAAKQASQFVGGEGPEQVRADHACLDAPAAQAVGRVLRGLGSGVQQEDRHVGILHTVGVNERIVPAAHASVFVEDFTNHRGGGVHRQLLLVLVIDEVRIAHVGPDRDRIAGVNGGDGCRHLAEEGTHVGVIGEDLDAALLMAGEEAVVGDTHREADIGVLTDAKGHDVHVVHGLRVAGQEDDPAAVEQVVEVGVVAADIEGPANAPGDEVEEHRIAGAGLTGSCSSA